MSFPPLLPELALRPLAVQALMVPMNMLLVIALSAIYLAMSRTYRASPRNASKCLQLLSLGWAISVPYLFIEFLRIWQTIADPKHVSQTQPLGWAIAVSAASSALLLGAVAHTLYTRRAQRRTIIAGTILTGVVFIVAALVGLDSEGDRLPYATAIAYIVFSILALLHQRHGLLVILKNADAGHLGTMEPVLVGAPLVLFAALQVLYLPNLINPTSQLFGVPARQVAEMLNPWGFTLGVAFKLWHLIGLVTIESRRAARLQQILGQAAEIENTTRLLSKALHELKTAGKELELGISALESDFLTRQNIKISSAAAQGSGVRILAILEGIHQIVNSGKLPNRVILDSWGNARLTTLLEAAALTVKATYPLLHKEKIYDHRVEYECHYSANVDVYCRKFMITQLFVNIIRNAYDSMYPTGGTLRLTVRWLDRRESDGGRIAQVSLEDEGHGIPLELQERIFEDGFTTRYPRDNRGHGMGIVREVVEQHGGELRISSPHRNGRGTLIEVLLRANGMRTTGGVK